MFVYKFDHRNWTNVPLVCKNSKIYKWLFTLFSRVDKTVLQFWANEVAHLFGEDASTYYTPYCSKTKSEQHGKLYYKWTNTRKFVKAKGTDRINLPVDPVNGQLDEIYKSHPASPALKGLWRATYQAREQFKKLTILDYYERFPILKDSVAVELVQQ